jgi:integrase
MSARTKDRLSKATLYATLSALKRFFIWLAGQPGYKSRISYSDAEYFNLSAKETRIAKAHRDARVPTLEQIRHVLRTMPASTEIERRDRALIAFTILTGARDGAIASIKLKHIDTDQGRESFGGSTIRYSPRRRSWLGTVGISRHRGSTASTGAAPAPSGTSSSAPSRRPACPTSTRTASGRPWPFWAAIWSLTHLGC